MLILQFPTQHSTHHHLAHLIPPPTKLPFTCTFIYCPRDFFLISLFSSNLKDAITLRTRKGKRGQVKNDQESIMRSYYFILLYFLRVLLQPQKSKFPNVLMTLFRRK